MIYVAAGKDIEEEDRVIKTNMKIKTSIKMKIKMKIKGKGKNRDMEARTEIWRQEQRYGGQYDDPF